MRNEVHGHWDDATGKIQHAVRYTPSVFYKLVRAAEKEEKSVNAMVNEIVENYLKGVK